MVANPLEKHYLCRQFVIYCDSWAVYAARRYNFINVL